ncbi:MAG: putative baseplate assembly protein [Ilumatobacteraceae bacterium]
MSLPVPNLDDRTFQDRVDEAKRLIPTYCPEWTNHNLTDPGVALIELFAWMTELSLFRLNQVPDTFYTHMLNMLGFEPFPATAARADLTFWLVDVVEEPVIVPGGTQVSTAGDIGAPRVFTTLGDLVISQPELMASLVSPGADAYVDVWDALRLPNQAVICFPRTPTVPGDRFYLGFGGSLAGNAIRMSISANVEGIGVIPSKPPLRWEVWQGAGWIPATVYRDTTGGLNRDGQITLLVPPAHEPLTLGGQRAYWMRARVLEPEPGQPTYRTSPQIRQIRVDSIGGSITAEHSSATPREVLGTSTGKQDQRFTTSNTPVLDRMPGETLTVTDGDVVTEWTEVPDFVESGPDDTHFVWNSTTGEVRFGPLIRYPDGSTRQHGAIPREGSLIAATGYRWGGGAAGNVGPATLVDMRTSLPYVDRVENIAPAIGGVDAETVDNAKRRGPHSLRAGGRAVTTEDFERLAAEADPAIARVRCLPPEITGRPIRLLLVPHIERPGALLTLDDFALSDDMVARVSEHLDERRILGTAIEVGTPYYQGVTIAALMTARPGRPVTLVRERALATLYRYLNPLTGGPHGTGWPFDADLNAATVFQLLEAVEGVERVEEVLFFEHDLRNHERVGFGKELVKLERDSLFLAANHQVVVR